MDSIRVYALRPAGSELFHDSESFLDELSEDWELDSVKSTAASIVISHAIGYQNYTVVLPTEPDLLLHLSVFKENVPSFSR
ncbi:MAG: hypothetical protein Fur006_43180 [Coleofasciculaceae cyanobacterium]|jgi:hypothetical protein